MQFKTDEQLRKYLTKRVEQDLSCKSWKFCGMQFTTWASYFNGDFHTRVEYACDLRNLKAYLTRGYEFNGTYQTITEKTFNGDNAISDCIAWTVERLMEIYKLLNERTAPYANNKALYDIMVNRPIVLKETV